MDDILAGNGAGVGDAHLEDDLLARVVHGGDCLVKGGVGEAIAKGVGNGTRSLDATLAVKLTIREGRMHQSGGLVVAVALVDALLVLHKVTGLLSRGDLATTEEGHEVDNANLGVAVVEATEVLVGGVSREVGGVDVGQATGGVDLAHQNLG